MNEQNLKPLNKRTKSEQREIAKKAGLASGKARKRKKYIKENLEELMTMDLKDIKLKSKMLDLGIEDDFSIQNAISCSVVQQALNGNLKAFNIIVDMLRTKLENSEMTKNIQSGITFIVDIPTKQKEKKELDVKKE